MKMHHKIAYVAGRSGGHILPAITLAAQTKLQSSHIQQLFFTTDSVLDKNLAQGASCIDQYIPLRLDNFPRKNIMAYPRFMVQFARCLLTSFMTLRTFKPEKIISTGGYISIPVCFAGWILRIPIELYELNATPGRSTRLVARLAHRIFVCFPSAANYFSAKQCRVRDYPIRFTLQQKQCAQEHALNLIGLKPERTTLFIVGGSQGSLFINTLIKKLLEKYPALCSTIQIIHQTGAQDQFDWTAYYAHHNIPALVFTFHNHVEHYYAAADLIVCRSGAGTLWEIAFFEKRAITIPIVAATTDHQMDNARAFAALYSACTVITQQEIDCGNGLESIAHAVNVFNKSQQIVTSSESFSIHH